MKSVFVDTNVLLRVFNKTSDTLNEIETFIELIKAKKITLYTTEQVKNEYYRNVESEISSAIKSLKEVPEIVELPRITQDFGHAGEILEAFKKIRDNKKQLLELVLAAATDGKLRADNLVSELFKISEVIEYDAALIAKARVRRELGDPPGKRESLGDQLNWECLLKGAKNDDLYILSQDSDYLLGKEPIIRRFLADEWERSKKSKLFLYKDLKSFLQANFPEAKKAVDVKKAAAIEALEKSSNFVQTHKTIADLSEVFESIKLNEAERLFRAFIDNTQVAWLAFDDDVREFYSKLFSRYYSDTEPALDIELYGVAPYLKEILPF